MSNVDKFSWKERNNWKRKKIGSENNAEMHQSGTWA